MLDLQIGDHYKIEQPPELDHWWALFLDRYEKQQKKSEPAIAAAEIPDPDPDWDADFKTWSDEDLAQLTLLF